MVVVVETIEPRTFYTAVRRVMEGCGMIDPGSLADPTADVRMAMEAVQDALNEVWYKHTWEWRRKMWLIEISQGVMWYDLPADWEEAGAKIGMRKIAAPLDFMPWEKLLDARPYIRSVPVEYGGVAMTTQASTDGDPGTPQVWTMFGDYLGIYNPPDEDFMTNYGSDFIATYFRALIEPYDGTDLLGIPVSLYPAHHGIALGLFKQSKQWPDAGMTESRGRSLLMTQVGKASKRDGKIHQLTEA